MSTQLQYQQKVRAFFFDLVGQYTQNPLDTASTSRAMVIHDYKPENDGK
jgi:hypothetical protein